MDLQERFTRESELVADVAPRVLSILLERARYADLFFQHRLSSSFLVKRSPSLRMKAHDSEKTEAVQGIGLYAFDAANQVHHSLAELPDFTALSSEASQLRDALFSGKSHISAPLTTLIRYQADLIPDLPGRVSALEKKQLIEALLETAYSYEPELTAASIEYQDRSRSGFLVNSDGYAITQEQAWMGVRASITLKGEQPIQAHATRMTRGPFGQFAFGALDVMVVEAIERARRRQSAAPISPGNTTVVFEGAGNAAGIWLHECIGHLLEADQTQAYDPSLKRGDAIGSPCVSIFDIPGQAPEYGRQFDDEGVPLKTTQLVDRGRLVELLSDRFHAQHRGIEQTGNGFRESYIHPPLPRMSTLHLEPGNQTREELIASVEHGVYVSEIRHGYTNPDTRQFHLVVEDGCLIENGRCTRPIANFTIRGNSTDCLRTVYGVANDLPPTPHLVKCKKSGQVLMVSVSAPSVLVHKLDAWPNNP